MLSSHPERLVMALVVAAWAWILGHAALAQRMSCCPPQPTVAQECMAWTAMIVAMMLPTTLPGVRDVAARSYRHRRIRAVVAFSAGYLAWWILLGAGMICLRQFDFAHDQRLGTALCVLSAAWVLLPIREQWWRSCHRTIALCPVGWRADCDAFRQGAMNGWPCVATCWPLMAACTVTGHNLIVMVVGSFLTSLEKQMFRLQRLPLLGGALLLAVWTCTL
jgi:predicted metal-binding membrane protein